MPFKSPCKTSYSTSTDTILYRFRENSKFWKPHKMADFDLLKVNIFSFIQWAPPLTTRRRLIYCAWKSAQPFRLHPHVPKSATSLQTEKKHNPLYVWVVGHMYLSPRTFLRNQILLDYLGQWPNQSCQIYFQSVHACAQATAIAESRTERRFERIIGPSRPPNRDPNIETWRSSS